MLDQKSGLGNRYEPWVAGVTWGGWLHWGGLLQVGRRGLFGSGLHITNQPEKHDSGTVIPASTLCGSCELCASAVCPCGKKPLPAREGISLLLLEGTANSLARCIHSFSRVVHSAVLKRGPSVFGLTAPHLPNSSSRPGTLWSVRLHSAPPNPRYLVSMLAGPRSIRR
jgi:hypothetical protein